MSDFQYRAVFSAQNATFASLLDKTTGATLAGIGSILLLELAAILAATGGHLAYVIEAPYVHLTLAEQILHGHYGLTPEEAAAPSSTILYPFLLAALAPLRLGAALPLTINIAATLGAGVAALLLADECGLPLRNLAPARIFALAASVTLALNLAGLAFTGLEHSLHVFCSILYLLGLARFVQRGRCDWWWFLCIIIQPLIRFEGAGLLLADILIFVYFRRVDYALAVLAIGIGLVGAYSLFLHRLGLPLLPSSVLSRSEWSNAAVAEQSGAFAVLNAVARNFYRNLNSFGSTQILGAVALAWLWLGARLIRERLIGNVRQDRIRFMLVFFLAFVSLAQLAGGTVGWAPPRYEAYVLAIDLCALAVIFGDAVSAWCSKASWLRIGFSASALLLIFGGYATQTLVAPAMARAEYLGPLQLRRFVTDFYRAPVATDQLGDVNFDNPHYVLDLSGLSTEAVRQARAAERSAEWMDGFLADRGIDLAIVNSADTPSVPAAWSEVAELRVAASRAANRILFYSRRPEAAAAISAALAGFADTLPQGDRLIWANAASQGGR